MAEKGDNKVHTLNDDRCDCGRKRPHKSKSVFCSVCYDKIVKQNKKLLREFYRP